MKRKTWGLLALMAVLWGTAGCDQATPPTALDRTDGMEEMAADKRSGDVIPDQYIVVFNDNVKNPRAMAAQLAQEHRAEILHTYEFALSGMAIKAPAAAAEGLRRNPNVAYVEADAMAYPTLTTQSPATWGIDRVDQRNRPLNNAYSYNYTGLGVRAYVIDSGIDYAHPQFEGRAFNSKDYVNDGNTDCNSHGTHVAGTIGSKTYGIAKQVGLYSVRVFPCSGGASYTTIIAAVDHVTAEKNSNPGIPMVANMSLGGGVSSTLNNAVTNSISKGVVYAVSAGNDNGADACTKSPASTPNALTVGSSTSSDARSSFSNIGPCIDLFAPGSSILSTVPGGGTGTKSGTSMSAPHVAGVAALVLQANPTASAAQINQAIVDNATSGVLTSIGTGSPNKLLYSLIGDPPPPQTNQPPTANFTFTTSGLTANFTDTSTDSDGTIASRSWNFGDGATSTATNPTKTYAAAGTYSVTLTVTDNAGATASASQSVTVTAPVLVAVSKIDMTVTKAGNKYYATAQVYAAPGSTVSGDFLFKGRYLNTSTGVVASSGFATLNSNQIPAKSADVFGINLTGATGVTTCSVSVSAGSSTCP